MWPVFVTWISLNNWPSWFPGSKCSVFTKLPADKVIVSDWTSPCGTSMLFKIFWARFDWVFTESISWFSSICSNWFTLFSPKSTLSCRPIWFWKYEFLKSLFVKHDFPFCSHWQGRWDLHLHLIASDGELFEIPRSMVSICSSSGHNLLQYECWFWPFEQFHSAGIGSHLVRFSTNVQTGSKTQERKWN